VTASAPSLQVEVAGVSFQNPIVLASGTAGYGRELADVMDLDRLGGIVTKAVSVEPRHGAPAPRVAEIEAGMMNAIGLANPGLESVRATQLPWLAQHVTRARVIVNVVGSRVEDFVAVVTELTDAAPVAAFELNVSCPNVACGGTEFGADRDVLADLVGRVRRRTKRAIFVKLSPALPDIGSTARVAVDSGADAITVVNTLPGLAIDVETRRPELGYGTGGMSGPALRPTALLATWRVHQAVRVPIMGLGGVSTVRDAVRFLLAGATLVGVGTAALQDPRRPERLVSGLGKWCARHGISSVSELVGGLEMQTKT
jgi:dihydroorotate dehydrogenase (NAD+) catalytic subunit